MPVQKKGGLGKGLGALFSEQNPTPARQREETAPSPAEDGNAGGVLEIDINEITPNRSQPRKVFDEEKLEELAGMNVVKETPSLSQICVAVMKQNSKLYGVK